MAFLWTTLCAAIMVTVVMSKPVSLNEGEDSSKGSESSEESYSSEEIATDGGLSQEAQEPELTETAMPNAVEETEPLGTAALLPSTDIGPSPATLNTSALPDPEDPQTSTDIDALLLMPDDPSQTAEGMDVSQGIPGADPSQDSISADTVHVLPDSEGSLHPGLPETGTNQPQVTNTASQQSPQGVDPPIPLQLSTAPPLPIAMENAVTGVPVCFTFQFTTTEPNPPRGDSV